MKVAFQGEHGAYSELAALQYFGDKAETLPCKTFPDVFDRVAKGLAEFGIVPIENSLEGSIGQNYDLLTKSEIGVYAEVILRVEHCLIANPGVELKAIRKVYSHPQALGQCRKFIEERGLEEIPVYDTAGSIKFVKDSGATDAAGIASSLAAKIYDMKIIRKNIETDSNNFTRFFIISWSKPSAKKDKTSATFTVKNEPGSLYNALKAFSANGINLTKLESRPIIGKPWEYRFYIDIEGDSEDPNIKKALLKLSEETDSIKVIGSYPKAGSTFSNEKKVGLFGKKRIAVIGAAGGMGRWFCRFFVNEGFDVVASGRTQSKVVQLGKELKVKVAGSNVEAVKQSDIVFVSVLFNDFEAVVKEISPFIRSDQIVMDMTSTKGEPVRIMQKYLKEATVLGTHPLFGPKADSNNQNFILTPASQKEEKTAIEFKAWLENRGFHVEIMSPSKHDNTMSIALALSHFVGIAIGETWMDFDFRELRKSMPSSFKRLLGLVENISESDPVFYANLQMILPRVLDAEGKFIENAKRLYELVKKHDETAFAEEMKRLSDAIRAEESAKSKG